MSAQQINDGGPAFPHLRRHIGENIYQPIAEGGMSLRDYFAAHAPLMVPADVAASNAGHWAACVGLDAPPSDQPQSAWWLFWNTVEARLRYAYADAMLSARAPKPEPAP